MRRTPRLATLSAALLFALWAVPAVASKPQSPVDRAVEQREQLAAKTPDNPEAWQKLAAYYSQRAKEANLPPGLARRYVLRGLEVNDRALSINGQYYEAVSLKGTLLRQRARIERAPSLQKRLIAEAELYEKSAAELERAMRPAVR